jgi:hypothetical protein
VGQYTTLRRDRARLDYSFRLDAEDDAQKVQDAALSRQGAMAIAMSAFFRRLGIDVNTVFGTHAARGDSDQALTAVAIAEAREALFDEVNELFDDALERAGTRAAQLSTAPAGFEANTEALLRQARKRSSTLVSNISSSTREGIRIALQAAFERGDAPRVAARSIKPLVGNLPRHVAAVENFRNRLITAGHFSRSKIDSLSATYSGKLLKHRTEMIARTEMIWSANAAQQEYWTQLRDAGLIPASSKRIWVTAQDDRLCEQCAPMEGAIVGFEEPFVSDELGLPGQLPEPRNGPAVVADYPPLHPMCRCTVVLDPDAIGIRTDPGGQTLEDVREELLDKARVAEPAATRTLQEQANKFGGEMRGLEFKFKSPGSLDRKMRAGSRKNPFRTPQQVGDEIRDALRYTMVLDEANYASGAIAVIDDLEAQGWSQIDIKKYWLDEGDYRGINGVMLSPQGAKVELQFHTATSLAVKEDVLHPLYEQWRVLDPTGDAAELLKAQMIQAAHEIPIPAGIADIPGRLLSKSYTDTAN